MHFCHWEILQLSFTFTWLHQHPDEEPLQHPLPLHLTNNAIAIVLIIFCIMFRSCYLVSVLWNRLGFVFSTILHTFTSMSFS